MALTSNTLVVIVKFLDAEKHDAIGIFIDCLSTTITLDQSLTLEGASGSRRIEMAQQMKQTKLTYVPNKCVDTGKFIVPIHGENAVRKELQDLMNDGKDFDSKEKLGESLNAIAYRLNFETKVYYIIDKTEVKLWKFTVPVPGNPEITHVKNKVIVIGPGGEDGPIAQTAKNYLSKYYRRLGKKKMCDEELRKDVQSVFSTAFKATQKDKWDVITEQFSGYILRKGTEDPTVIFPNSEVKSEKEFYDKVTGFPNELKKIET